MPMPHVGSKYETIPNGNRKKGNLNNAKAKYIFSEQMTSDTCPSVHQRNFISFESKMDFKTTISYEAQ